MPPILLVEDDADIRDVVAELLRGEGYDVHGAENGEQALAYLHEAEREPCLILLDLMMPVVDGWQVLARLRAQDRLLALPVVVMSASSPAAAPADVAAFVRKPIDLDLLLGLVRRYCGRTPAEPD
ncbi:Response regulator receiver domain-containing protein [Nannocystis exedens]|uniref:Response regulator receiver domain-containing protein n=1 Tax=Nannocystis exedens TaxID=54 RepID=A0A1I2EN78_9BACT|nr:response regulator [Nannocystis exedens]PCC73902.1 Transcriptional regulatory protein AfsQ1 [Nannocystis exedens]SFE94482.1 Response regulator receiver domain-containing protein [Nannocystis exedens]